MIRNLHESVLFVSTLLRIFSAQLIPNAFFAELFKNFTAIKTKYPQLKTLLSVGGWQQENGVFSALVRNADRRALFIESVLLWMKEYNLDGVDMAWRFPGVSYRGGSPRDKENYASLIRVRRSGR